MRRTNNVMYQSLTSQIQALLKDEFIQKLKLGKYSEWALRLTPSEIVPVLSAIGKYGKLSPPCPDIDTTQTFSRHGLDQMWSAKIRLSQEQLNALSFLLAVYSCSSDFSKLTIPFEYSKESPDFSENVVWVGKLSSSDLFGIFWHIGGFGARNCDEEKLEACINDYHPRAQECLICLMRIAQRQTTYYQLAGERYRLPEHQ